MAGAKGLFFNIFVVVCAIIPYLMLLLLLLLLLREGRQNTPHRTEFSLHLIEDCFFQIFVPVAVFV